MEFDSIRPLISGAIGSLLAAWLTAKWSRYVPSGQGGKSAETLVDENRWLIRSSNVLFIGSVLAGLACYMTGLVARNDPSAILISFGGGAVLPLFLLAFVRIVHGRERVNEAYTAICIASKTPRTVGIVLISFGAACLAAGIAIVIFRKR